MTVLNVVVDGDNAWNDLANRPRPPEAERVWIVGLAHGMISGKPSVVIRFDLPDGTVAIGQTSLQLFLTAADALKARYGDPRT